LSVLVLSGAIVWDRVNEELPEFQKFNAAVLGISVDGVWCHLAFAVYRLEDGEWKIAHRYRDDNIRPNQARQ